MLALLSLSVIGAYAQQSAPDTSPAKATSSTATKNPPSTGSTPTTTAGKPVAPAATMQLKRDVTGDLSYRFIAAGDDSAAPVPLPTATGADNVVAITIPSSLKRKAGAVGDYEGTLEVIDLGRGRVAHLPVKPGSITTLTDADFKLIQTVLVPVQVQNKGGVYNATVTLTDSDKKISKSWLLKPADNGVASFTNVTIGTPVTVTVSSGSNPPFSQTLTLPSNPPAEGYRLPVIYVTWPDAKTVALPAPPPTVAATTPAPATTAPAVPAPAPSGGGLLGGIVEMAVSLLFLGAIAYGVLWAYKNGHVKRLLDNLGIQTQPMTATGPQGSPFDKPERAPIQPITEGTADPLAGGIGMAPGMPPVANAGPRLVATMGAYAGNIFPLNSGSVDIGRDTVNPVALPQDTNTSRRHATLQIANGQVMVVDNGSSNGTFVNGVRIPSQQPQPLRSGDELQIGMTRFRFEA